MRIATLAAIGSVTALLAGCVIIDADDHDFDARYSTSSAERVYSAAVKDDAVTVRVAASGCTTKDFFDVEVDHHGGDEFSVEFVRTRRDYCKMMQDQGEKLSWTFAELGLPAGAEVSITNPVGR